MDSAKKIPTTIVKMRPISVWPSDHVGSGTEYSHAEIVCHGYTDEDLGACDLPYFLVMRLKIKGEWTVPLWPCIVCPHVAEID